MLMSRFMKKPRTCPQYLQSRFSQIQIKIKKSNPHEVLLKNPKLKIYNTCIKIEGRKTEKIKRKK
ncbi:hypothetical protein HanIR_Chr12g0610911 [Helianthus annuus]|nr:hypothetical protein HanIR_Chr12g0610911 [Helianthus annuus]